MMMVKSVLSEKVEIKNSMIHGKGVFAKSPIKKGEIVFIKGGHILTREKLFSSGVINCYLPIDDNYCLGATKAEEEEDIKLNDYPPLYLKKMYIAHNKKRIPMNLLNFVSSYPDEASCKA
ncbi:MAG: hypothetical protein LBM68_01095, partial [Bacteroidales bacterium]|nr:hypothetical protein [Bacteroidales bacterium]